MSPAAAIAMLDRQLAAHGQTVVLRRGAVALPARAFVRDYAPEELVGGIVQGARQVILSPTGQTGPFAESPVDRNDEIEIDGRPYNVETANPVRIADAVVRVNLQVTG